MLADRGVPLRRARRVEEPAVLRHQLVELRALLRGVRGGRLRGGGGMRGDAEGERGAERHRQPEAGGTGQAAERRCHERVPSDALTSERQASRGPGGNPIISANVEVCAFRGG
ncbi:hypothetical protein E1292_49390 [Nonomuraea deserti]|uniref:Uncharacterized protein n=1 Tax=Nonomuraea deserti TaxID=1848322 RepID=A0A4R4U090_9ACTN|nr:hypothetical protein E1292_49390 [Nonomuraea deserti]